MGKHRLWKIIFIWLLPFCAAFSGSPDRHWQYYASIKKQLSKMDKHILFIDEQPHSPVASFILIEEKDIITIGEISLKEGLIENVKRRPRKASIDRLVTEALRQIKMSTYFKAQVYVDTPLYSIFRSDGYYFQYFMFTENQREFCEQLTRLEEAISHP